MLQQWRLQRTLLWKLFLLWPLMHHILPKNHKMGEKLMIQQGVGVHVHISLWKPLTQAATSVPPAVFWGAFLNARKHGK